MSLPPASERPLTERMRAVLETLSKESRPITCNQIGHSLGFSHGMYGDRYSHTGKRMGAANRVNFAVTALERRGLVCYALRPDGLSGGAYEITAAGREALVSDGGVTT